MRDRDDYGESEIYSIDRQSEWEGERVARDWEGKQKES